MNDTSRLLDLPPEIRDVILRQLFSPPLRCHQRSPSHRRLRASRIDKNDARGVLSACRLLRREALPVFCDHAVLIFRRAADVVEFVDDPRLDCTIKENAARIAVDEGDVNDLLGVRVSQMRAIQHGLAQLPRFRTIEFRVYARTDNIRFLHNLNALDEIYESMRKAYDDRRSKPDDQSTNYADFTHRYGTVVDTMLAHKVMLSVCTSRERYQADNQNIPHDVYLKVCNLVVKKKGIEPPILGMAQQAVKERLKVTGATHITDKCILDREAWSDDWETWRDAHTTPAGERYH